MNATWQELLDFQPRKNRVKEMGTKFSMSLSSSPSKTQLARSNNFFIEPSMAANNNDPESFHCAIGPILVVAQVCGMFPVTGILKPTPMKLKFVKFSFLTAYSAFVTMVIFIMTIFLIKQIVITLNSMTVRMEGGLAAVAMSVVYGGSVLILISFFWLSPRWVILQRDWRSMEQFLDSSTKLERPKLRRKFNVISSFTLIWGVVLQILNTVVDLENHDWMGSENATCQNFLQIYCAFSQAFNLHTVDYTIFHGILIFIIHNVAVFICVFNDVFVMLVSIGLAERYKVLNKELMISTSKPRTMIDWCRYRECYAALSSMVKKADDNVSPLIFVSFAKNLYFICLYLLKGLSHSDESNLSIVYSFIAFLFLIVRTACVSLLAAKVNDQSKVILPTLYICSTSTYNVDTERLIYQLSTDDIALTGLHFFSITRNFLMGVVSVVMTYEIVLWQFNT